MPSASRARPTKAACAATVCAKSGGATRASEAWRVPGDRTAAPADRLQQRLPVGAGARVAVQEHDGLTGAGRSGLADRRPHAVDPQVVPAQPRGRRRPARARASQDACHDRRPQHVRRRLAHPHHGHERAGHPRVVLGRRPQAPQVGVDEAHRSRAVRLDLGQRQVRAHREAPRVVDRAARCAEEAAGEVVRAALQALAERDRLGRRHGHALTVGGVERADRVPAHQQAAREAAQALVAAPHAGREAMGGDVAERLGLRERLDDVRRGDGGGERGMALGVAGRAVRRAVATEREDPAPTLLGEQEQRARTAGDGADRARILSAPSAPGGSRRCRLA